MTEKYNGFSGDDSPKSKSENTPSGYRDGDSNIGNPDPKEVFSRKPTEFEKRKFDAEDRAAEEKRLQRIMDDVLENLNRFQLPSWVRKFGVWGLTTIATILSLLIIGQVTSFLSQLNSLPEWSQWTIGILLSLLSLVIVFLIFKLIVLSMKLRRNEQIDFQVIKALSARKELQGHARDQTKDAINKLRNYLKDFPITNNNEEKFTELGMSRNSFHDLTRVCKELIDTSQITEDDEWLKKYHNEFQATLDETAKRIYKSYAKRVAIKSAISPLPMLDTAIITALSLSMVRDLMTLYNLKVGPMGTGYILIHAIGQAYVAGELQDITESFADSLNDLIADHIGQVATTLTKGFGSKAAEGVVNGMMIYRLGRSTTRLLQPTC